MNSLIKELTAQIVTYDTINLALTRQTKPNLSFPQVMLLSTFFENETMTNQEIAEYYSLDKSTLSRLINRLLKLQYLKQVTNKAGDRRYKHLSITEKGKKALIADDTNRNKAAENLIGFYTKQKQSQFINFFKYISDITGAPKLVLRSCEHPLRVQQRRLSITLKLLRRDLLETKISRNQLRILRVFSIAADSEQLITLSDLKRNVAFDISYLSRQVGILVERGILTKERDKIDTRFYYLKLTNFGQKLYNSAVNILSEAMLSEAADKKKLESAHLIFKELSDFHLTPEVKKEFKGFRIKVVQSKEDIKKTRKFHVKNNQSDIISSELVHEDNISFVLYRNAKIFAFIEVKLEAACAHIINFTYLENQLSRYVSRLFLNSVVKTIFDNVSIGSVKINNSKELFQKERFLNYAQEIRLPILTISNQSAFCKFQQHQKS